MKQEYIETELKATTSCISCKSCLLLALFTHDKLTTHPISLPQQRPNPLHILMGNACCFQILQILQENIYPALLPIV